MSRPVLKVIDGSPRRTGGGEEARAADARLAAGVAQGEAGAIRALTQRCLPRVHGVAARLLGDREEAEDVAQETFVKVWRKIALYDPDKARLETWVTRIAMNACYDRLRKKRETQISEDAPERADGAASAESRLTGEDALSRVRAAVAALPERQKLALQLCHFQDHTNIEAAQIMEVSVEALESLLARARRALKAQLAADRDELIADAAGLHGSGKEI
ncbi:RNA polymerase sigma factor [Oceanicaulis sp. MMSF_3324]|uniref:RNA polymerase sigma factor n=1 Tax=Oceanicaulis sp. MMSF_3324 TaxID=3046702 RepID=UPI00273DFED8|nr:RNA polymerase sigma factor [Oceanicaulis sp. MMSF_3324]